MNKKLISISLLLILTCYTTHAFAQKPEPITHQEIQTINLNTVNHRLQALAKLQSAYPDHIKSISQDSITWTDGTRMLLNTSETFKPISEKLSNPTLADQLDQVFYKPGKPTNNPNTDPGRVRYEPFFKKMYGNSPEEVEKNLELVYWMPNLFGPTAYPLQVTKINNIHEKITHISDELEILVLLKPEYAIFLQNPGGTYVWRTIAGTSRLSAHSFGMTIDINAELSEYWQWDLKKKNLPITEDALLTYRNSIPWEIVETFEKYGFIWGGKWLHYDTMHFEYRPELIE